MMDWPMHAFTSKALKSNKKDGKSTGFLWTRGGDQFEMEEIVGSLFGFLAVFAFKFAKSKFGIHSGTFSKEQSPCCRSHGSTD